MKPYIVLFILFFTILLYSCKNNNNINNQFSDTTLNVQTINNDTIELSSGYLFKNFDNENDQYIFSMTISNSNVICTYKSRWYSIQYLSTTFKKNGDTIILNKWEDSLSTFALQRITVQVPKKLLLLQGGDLKVIALNKKLIARPNEYSGLIISRIDDILKVSSFDSINYYGNNYVFKTEKMVYESPCSNMDSYYLGISYARDQLGGGLLADCDYLYKIAVIQTANVDYYCFCKGVSKWLSDNGRSY
jgi:hypothetical protein